MEKLSKGWTIKYLTELTEPVDFYLRGEEYSAQMDYFFESVAKKELQGISSFESALHTDKVIDMLFTNAIEN